jgi:hypothetical protein
MPKPTNPARNAELAAIHIAKAQAGMRAAHDDALTTALELRLLAKRIDDGQIAVPQAPTFERE